MGKKLYVGNLSYNVDENTLVTMFSVHGNVETAKIVIDRESGRSKGFAFVEMSSPTEATAAIEGLNGTEQFGRAIKISEAKPVENRSGGFRNYGQSRF